MKARHLVAALATMTGSVVATSQPASAGILCYGDMPEPARVSDTAIRATGTMLCSNALGNDPLGTLTILERWDGNSWEPYGSPEFTRCPDFGDTDLYACEVTDGAPYRAGRYRTRFVFYTFTGYEDYYSDAVNK
jgi:hypothetical protein